MMRSQIVFCAAASASILCSLLRAECESPNVEQIAHSGSEALPSFFTENSVTGMCVNLNGGPGTRQTMMLDLLHREGGLDVCWRGGGQTQLKKQFSTSEWGEVIKCIRDARFETWEHRFWSDDVIDGCSWEITFLSSTNCPKKITGHGAAPRYILFIDDIAERLKSDVTDSSFAVSFAGVSSSTDAQWLMSAVRKWHDDKTGLTWFYSPEDDSKWWGSSIVGVWPRPSGDLKIPGCIQSVIIKKIYPKAFRKSLGLTSVEIPATVAELGGDVFDGCENLKEITFKGPRPSFPERIGESLISGRVASDKCVVYADGKKKGWTIPGSFCGFRVLERTEKLEDK